MDFRSSEKKRGSEKGEIGKQSVSLSRRSYITGLVATIVGKAGLGMTGAVGANQQASGTTAYTASDSVTAFDIGLNEVVWSFEPDTVDSFGTPLVVDGTVYVPADADDTGKLYAVNGVTGEQEWMTSLSEVALRTSAPVVTGEMIFVISGRGTDDGTVYAVDRSTGETEWEYTTTDTRLLPGNQFMPRGSSDTVYCGIENGEIHGLDINTGERVFISDTLQEEPAGVAVFGETLFASDSVGRIVAIDPETGDSRWRTEQVSSSLRSAPVFYRGNFYVIGSSEIIALDAETGSFKWDFSPEHNSNSVRGLSITDNTVLVRGHTRTRATEPNDTVISAVDSESGTLRWNTTTNMYSVPTEALGSVFVGERVEYSHPMSPDKDRGLVVLDAADGAETFNNDRLPNSTPTVVTDPTAGNSIDSLVRHGIRGHHDGLVKRSENTELTTHTSDFRIEMADRLHLSSAGEGISEDVEVELTNDSDVYDRQKIVVELAESRSEFPVKLSANETTTETFTISKDLVVTNGANPTESGDPRVSIYGLPDDKSVNTDRFELPPGTTESFELVVSSRDSTASLTVEITEEEEETDDEEDVTGTDDAGPGFGVGEAIVGTAGASYLLKRQYNKATHDTLD